MSPPRNKRIIAAVGQDWFDSGLNRFCKLVPGVYVDGVRPEPEDYPNDGEIWWMMTEKTRLLGVAGRLVSCELENGLEYQSTDPTKSWFQAVKDSVSELDPKRDGIEVLSLPSDSVSKVEELGEGTTPLKVSHTPCKMFLLRWRGDIYGPFETTTVQSGSGAGLDRVVHFRPADQTNHSLYRFPHETFDEITNGKVVHLSVGVTDSKQMRLEALDLQTIDFQIVLASEYQELLRADPSKLTVEPLERKLRRFAKQFLTRKRKRQFIDLLEELKLAATDGAEFKGVPEAISDAEELVRGQVDALDRVAEELLDSGVFGEDRLKHAEAEHAQKYIEENKAKLGADIEAAISKQRDELKNLRSECESLEAELENRKRAEQEKAERELQVQRDNAYAEIDARREQLRHEQDQFNKERDVHEENLKQVTKELRDSGAEVVNRFLSVAPLLQSSGFLPSGATGSVPSSPESHEAKPEPVSFSLPAWVTSGAPHPDKSLGEEEFFDRFIEVVLQSRYTYRPFDLQRFHLSIKCGDLTVLGGPSGTGKSSLPALYGKALLGENTADRPECLMVNVNPSWMDIRDLIGHLNSLDRLFSPAETGLFKALVTAHEETLRRQQRSGLHLICLDEMNLAQVEHYFSEFMLALERTGDHRAIQCFSAESASEADPFRTWARLPIAPSIRFVGTVNFDETTRLLSDRFLDRANLLKLLPDSLPSLDEIEGEEAGGVAGPMVTLSDFREWTSDKALPKNLAEIIDKLRPVLRAIGSPLSPRVYRGICRFVGSSAGIMSADEAFDAQLVQRVIPKIRNLVTRQQLEALDDMTRIVEESGTIEYPESSRTLNAMRNAAQSSAWDSGE